MEYKSNSHKSREENIEEKDLVIKKVTTGKTSMKKEPISRKFADTFLSESMSNVKSYLINDVLIPTIKDTFVELVNNGSSMLVYGSPSKGRRSTGRTDYNAKSRVSRGDSSRPSRSERSRERYSYDEIIFESRGDALEVQEMLEEIIDKYHMVSIADFYELSGNGDQSTYTDRKYGWYEFDGGLQITRDRDGYHIKLPKPVAFD